MQTTPDDKIRTALRVLTGLDAEHQESVLVAMFAAIYAHEETGDGAALQAMARDVAFTMRVHGSERYHKLAETGSQEPAKTGRPISQVLADLGM